MPKNKLIYSLAELKDKFIGAIGTPDRGKYEHKLRMALLRKMIKSTRK